MTSETDIEEMKITTPIMTEAHSKSIDMGEIYGSIMKGGGNLAGFIGEGCVDDYLRTNCQMSDWTNTYEYDIILNNDTRVDVKTKQTSVKPKLDYDCSISDGKRQDCDVYVFTRVKKDFSVCWLLGFMPAKEYFEKANFMEKGTIDPSNGWKVSRDCWNLPISELRPMYDLLDDGPRD